MDSYAKEIFRKFLHLIAVIAMIWYLFLFDDWKVSVLYAVSAIVIIFPALILLSFIPGISNAINARKKGEFALSYLAYIFMYVQVASVCWGAMGSRILTTACVMAWGPGDAAAALIGKKFGIHKLGKKKAKSLEGSMAMFVLSFIGVFITLWFSPEINIPLKIIVSLLVAVVSTVTEFYVLNGFDTFFCPVSAMIVFAFLSINNIL